MMNTASAIELIDVHKRYGSLSVLRGLSLQVNPGEVFGFLGRNGAGKSTAIRILMGISQADAGKVRVFGQPVRGNQIAVRQRIGYVAQEQHFYPWMSPNRLAKFVSPFYPNWHADRYNLLLDKFSLPARRPVGTFSGGMKAKLALSIALATMPELLILDEPTAGMDPVARREFLTLVKSQAIDQGTTIFFSTHLMADIGSVADRIGIVESGATIYQGTLQDLSSSAGDPDEAGQPGSLEDIFVALVSGFRQPV